MAPARAAITAWLKDMQHVQFTRMSRRRSSRMTASSSHPIGALTFRLGYAPKCRRKSSAWTTISSDRVEKTSTLNGMS